MSSRTAALFLGLVVLLTLSAGNALADDEQVWAALKQGGKVILLRHALLASCRCSPPSIY
jgi:hypothetical protein